MDHHSTPDFTDMYGYWNYSGGKYWVILLGGICLGAVALGVFYKLWTSFLSHPPSLQQQMVRRLDRIAKKNTGNIKERYSTVIGILKEYLAMHHKIILLGTGDEEVIRKTKSIKETYQIGCLFEQIVRHAAQRFQKEELQEKMLKEDIDKLKKFFIAK